MRTPFARGPRSTYGFTLLVLVIAWVSLCPVGVALAAKQPPPPPPLVGTLMQGLFPALAEDLGLPAGQKGLLVLGVYEGSPAQTVGLQPGDIILEVMDAKGKPVAVADVEKYRSVANAIPAAKPVTLKVLHAGQTTTLTIQRSPGPFGPLIQPPKSQAPRTLKVVPDGSGDTKTLEGALLRACPGDTILLHGVHGACDVWRSEITLASLDPAKPATIGGLSVSEVPGVHLKGLSVVAPSSTKQAAGIQLMQAPGTSVEECRIQGFATGIMVTSSQGVVLSGNVVYGNGQGIEISKQSEVRVTRNLVLSNRSGSDVAGGIAVWGSQVELSHNTILTNRVPAGQFPYALHKTYGTSIPGVGVLLQAGTNCLAFNNIVGNNDVGFLVAPGVQATIEYNDVYGHLIAPKTWSPKMFFEVRLTGGNANYLSGIQHEYVMAPAFSPDPHRHLYTPFLQFAPSQTNLSADPLFADLLKGDYRLAADSPLATKGRGGTYIGAFPPVGQETKPSPEPSAPRQGTAAPASPQGTSSGPAAWTQGGILYLPADAADRLVQAVRQRLTGDPALKERFSRAAVGVIPLALLDSPGVQLGRDFTESLTTALINAGFRLADQGRLAKALTELQVRDASQVDGDLARKIKEKSGCELLLLGSVADRGQSVAVNVRVLDAESGTYLAAERLEVPKALPPGSPAPAPSGSP
ncbi:MAG: FlgO family outer membrane protein [Bacillota bacterium]|nr:FlgO family outer membrane protein [Bacillota bacterium]